MAGDRSTTGHPEKTLVWMPLDGDGAELEKKHAEERPRKKKEKSPGGAEVRCMVYVESQARLTRENKGKKKRNR